MGPPSSGGVAVLELLGLLQPFDLKHQVNTAEAWNLFAQASRLAYADRDRYVGDPDFVHVPVAGMIDRTYLATRAKLIDPQHFAAGRVEPGEPPGLHADNWGRDQTPEFPSTSNMAIIDPAGNALAMTTTIEFAFGAHLMVRGFLLNNELTDFSYVPESEGKPVANRVEGGKRPRSSMSPTLVFDKKGKLVMSIGSAGGAAIITDVAKTLVATLDWNFSMQQAMDLPNVSNRNGATDVEAAHGADALAAALTAAGHEVRRSGRNSGLSGVRVTPQGFDGAADDRRAGTALGD
jgi:gamma-glutamyltranspeptidase/glutathione hydrolase